MRNLLACTAMTPVLAALAISNASAETTIGSATTTPLKTSNATDITVTSAGSITLTSGVAITQDSANKVSNAGTLKISNADNAAGIVSLPGGSGAISNSGTITLDEDYGATDSDKDGDNDGPFAKGTGRNGIWVRTGGAHVGAIDNSGTINIEGNQSAGIRLDAPVTGPLSTSGTISVIGDNSHGIITHDIAGSITLRGSISAVGANSAGVALLGDIDGALKIQGSINSTGYRSTNRPADTSKLDADDLLQGGPAITIAGNVTGGVIFDIPPALDGKDPDIDKDGLPDSGEGRAAVNSYGSSTAVRIGSATQDTIIGAVAADKSGYGLIVKGTVGGHGVYNGVAGNGLIIGGLGGGVTVAKGMLIAGTVTATSADSSATAVRLGSGANVGVVDISGSVNATGSSRDGTTARALVIDSGATSNTIQVSGTVSSTAQDAQKGAATAILDASGTVSSLSNSGRISASGGKSGSNIAIDLTANTSGVTLTQAAAAASSAAPSLTGDIRLGSGDDVVTVSAGSINGNVNLGAGANRFGLSGASNLTGALDFAGSASTLTLSDTASLDGKLINAGNTAVILNGGTLNVGTTGTIALGSLTAGGTSTIGIIIDADTGTHTMYDVAGAASFASGARVKATFTSVGQAAGDYVIIRASALNGAPTLADSALLPYMFKGSVTGNNATGEITLAVAAKSVQELGLSGSLSRAYSAIFHALDSDAAVADAFLGITDGATLTSQLRQMLPDHAGGAFEAVTSGSRATARMLSDPGGIYRTAGGRFGFWVQQVAFGSSKSVGSTASYDINGWGANGGAEYLTGLGAFGGSFAYIHGSDSAGDVDNAVDSDQFELAAHWRGNWGGLQTFARLSAAHVDFRGTRHFSSGSTSRTATGKWSGKLYSGAASASYEMGFHRFSLRPAIGIDYYRLEEGGYTETGGGDAFNLIVDGRTSDELTANGTLTLGYDLGSMDRTDGWMRVELEGGRRQIIGGSLGDTTARFVDGQSFTLSPEDRTNGWTGRVRLIGGAESFRVGGEFSAEEQQSHVAIAFRATVNFIL